MTVKTITESLKSATGEDLEFIATLVNDQLMKKYGKSTQRLFTATLAKNMSEQRKIIDSVVYKGNKINSPTYPTHVIKRTATYRKGTARQRFAILLDLMRRVHLNQIARR